MVRGFGKKLLEMTQTYFFQVTFPIYKFTPPSASSWWWFWNTFDRAHHGPV